MCHVSCVMLVRTVLKPLLALLPGEIDGTTDTLSLSAHLNTVTETFFQLVEILVKLLCALS